MELIGMKQNKILLTGFKKAFEGDTNSSKDLLDQISSHYDKFLFTNDYSTIIEEIDKLFSTKQYDYVIMFGQKPLIKRLSIELIGKQKTKTVETTFPLKKLTDILEKNHIDYKLSQHPGTSYCNFAYYHVLKHLEEIKTKVVFIHIPYTKNFKQMKKVIDVINSSDK